jgi:hypothetical protein
MKAKISVLDLLQISMEMKGGKTTLRVLLTKAERRDQSLKFRKTRASHLRKFT